MSKVADNRREPGRGGSLRGFCPAFFSVMASVAVAVAVAVSVTSCSPAPFASPDWAPPPSLHSVRPPAEIVRPPFGSEGRWVVVMDARIRRFWSAPSLSLYVRKTGMDALRVVAVSDVGLKLFSLSVRLGREGLTIEADRVAGPFESRPEILEVIARGVGFAWLDVAPGGGDGFEGRPEGWVFTSRESVSGVGARELVFGGSGARLVKKRLRRRWTTPWRARYSDVDSDGTPEIVEVHDRSAGVRLTFTIIEER